MKLFDQLSTVKELIYCNISQQEKTIINTTKVITTIEHSMTHYKGNSVICTIVDELIKKVKKERSTPNGVISGLYTRSKQMKLVSYLLAYIKKQTIYRLYISSKQMKLASYRWISCSNLRRKCNEHVHTQIAIASKLIKIIKILFVKNHAYLLLTTFADPS